MKKDKKLELLLATKNLGKVKEFKRLLKGSGFRIFSLNDFQNVPEVNEDGKSYKENALKKARFFSKYFNKLTVADDSGIEVDVLGGKPGHRSARYAGQKASSFENNQKLLKRLNGIPLSKRGATFRCVLAMVSPEGRELVVEATCRGRIGFKEVGKRGFGYDPIFYLPRYKKTMAQLTIEEKNMISHRGKALRKLKKLLSKFK